jgi:hypothetical protein
LANLSKPIVNVGETDVHFENFITFYVTPDNFETFFTIVSNKNYDLSDEDGHSIITDVRTKKDSNIRHYINLRANFNFSSMQFNFEHTYVRCHTNEVWIDLVRSNGSESRLYYRQGSYNTAIYEVDSLFTSGDGIFTAEMFQGDVLYLNYSDYRQHGSVNTENTKISNIKVTLSLDELIRIKSNIDTLKESDLINETDSDLLENIKNLKMVEKMYICQEDGIREVKEIHVGT